MKVFCAAAVHGEDPGKRLSAFILARDREGAVQTLRRSEDFAAYRLPPAELSLYAEDHAALPRLAGARSIRDRLRRHGLYSIRDLALVGN